jgi:hypothetical protein
MVISLRQLSVDLLWLGQNPIYSMHSEFIAALMILTIFIIQFSTTFSGTDIFYLIAIFDKFAQFWSLHPMNSIGSSEEEHHKVAAITNQNC